MSRQGHVLEVEPIGFASRLELGSYREAGIKDVSQPRGLNSWVGWWCYLQRGESLGERS